MVLGVICGSNKGAVHRGVRFNLLLFSRFAGLFSVPAVLFYAASFLIHYLKKLASVCGTCRRLRRNFWCPKRLFYFILVGWSSRAGEAEPKVLGLAAPYLTNFSRKCYEVLGKEIERPSKLNHSAGYGTEVFALTRIARWELNICMLRLAHPPEWQLKTTEEFGSTLRLQAKLN